MTFPTNHAWPASFAPGSTLQNRLASLLQTLELTGAEHIEFTGAEPVVPGRHALGAASAVALAAHGIGITQIWESRGGSSQRLKIDLQRAAYPGLCTFLHIWQNGHKLPARWDPDATNFFLTKDGRRFYLFYSPAYQQHSLKILKFMATTTAADSLARSVEKWDAQALEDALSEQKLIGSMARTLPEWLAHPQGQLMRQSGPVEIQRHGNASPRPWSPNPSRPLEGVKVIDMAHVLAGPLVSRVLAEQGAQVLHVAAPHQPDGHLVDLDTGLGKRNAFMDLHCAQDREKFWSLMDEADVFIHSWRPGSLEKHGLGFMDVQARRPGIIYGSLSCYGDKGPWANRGGYEPVAQSATGYAIAEGSKDAPQLASTITLNDYLAAYLGASGVVAALLRQRGTGGSYKVSTSLAQSSMWVQSFGVFNASMSQRVACLPPLREQDFESRQTAFGILKHPKPIVEYEQTPSLWSKGPEPFGGNALAWW